MDTQQIDYTGVTPVSPSKAIDDAWEPPRHVYFGPKDPNTGRMAKEPVYVHQQWPMFLYRKNGERVQATVVNSPAQRQALGTDWHDTPEKLGMITAPSFEQLQEAREKAERSATLTLPKK